MNDYNFGNFVCMLREKKGLTQADVAEQLGVTAAAVSKWENGSSKPRVEVLFKLAEILGVRPEELMAGHYIEGSEEADPNSFNIKLPRLSKKAIIAIICASVAFILILTASIFGIVLGVLEATKDSKEYKLAYAYLIESDKYAELGLNEDDITFNSYQRNVTKNADGEKVVNVELGFKIGLGRTMYVICHDDGDGWYVCEKCTKFN